MLKMKQGRLQSFENYVFTSSCIFRPPTNVIELMCSNPFACLAFHIPTPACAANFTMESLAYLFKFENDDIGGFRE